MQKFNAKNSNSLGIEKGSFRSLNLTGIEQCYEAQLITTYICFMHSMGWG